MKKAFILLWISVALSSCATAPPKYSSQDVSAATTRQEQITLYESLESELAANSSGSNAATYRQLMTQLGDKLGEREAAHIRETLNHSRLDSSLAPLSVVNQAEIDAVSIGKWNPAEYAELGKQLVEERTKTDAELQKQRSLLGDLNLGPDQVLRVQCLERISNLYGDNTQAEMSYKVAYEEVHEQFVSKGETTFRRSDYRSALTAYENLKRLDPEYPGVDDLIASARTGIESSDFRQLLIDQDIEGAYAAFLNLSNRQLTETEKAEFLGPANNLAVYFAGRAADSVQSATYANAYEFIKREAAIREWMNEPSQISNSTISGFTSAMFELADASTAEDLSGLEYGYLLLVEEFNPAYPTLDDRKRETAEIVYDNAIRRVGSVSIVSSDPEDSQIASQISAGVRQYLMTNIPEDVKIVEREQLEQVKRERSMDDDLDEHSQDYVKLESANYLIRGELLKAEVMHEIKQVKNRKRVVTGEEEVGNPAHEDWIKEKGKRKADHPDAPPKTITKEVKEDIELHSELHRKYGEVGVSYWVIDAISSEHLHSESVSRSIDLNDESQEGVQFGDFVQEVQLSQLPSDIEIFNDLVSQVVDYIARDLVGFLANPESDYFEMCQILADENENTKAAEQCAKAAVLRVYKSLIDANVIAKLKSTTLNSGMRPD